MSGYSSWCKLNASIHLQTSLWSTDLTRQQTKVWNKILHCQPWGKCLIKLWWFTVHTACAATSTHPQACAHHGHIISSDHGKAYIKFVNRNNNVSHYKAAGCSTPLQTKPSAKPSAFNPFLYLWNRTFRLILDKLSFTAVNLIRPSITAIIYITRTLWAHVLNSKHAQSVLWYFVDAHWLDWFELDHYCVGAIGLGTSLF